MIWLKRILKFLQNIFTDTVISFIGAIAGLALYATVTDTNLPGNISLHILITLVTLQFYRFYNFARVRL